MDSVSEEHVGYRWKSRNLTKIVSVLSPFSLIPWSNRSETFKIVLLVMELPRYIVSMIGNGQVQVSDRDLRNVKTIEISISKQVQIVRLTIRFINLTF